MTRQTLVAILGIFVLFGSMLPPAHAAGWSDAAYYDQASYGPQSAGASGSSGGLFHFGPTTSKIAKIGLTATGSVLAGLFGSQFGTIGTVLGGAAGFFVSKFVGDKLFGSNGYPAQYQSSGGGIFSRIKNTIFHRKEDEPQGQGGGIHWSDVRTPGSDDLNGARQSFYTAMQSYTKALQTGTQAEKVAAKTAYDAARTAYFSAKHD